MLNHLKPNSEALLKILCASAIVHLTYLAVCGTLGLNPDLNHFWVLVYIGWSIAFFVQTVIVIKRDYFK